jgi:hypothetical protein
MDSTSNGLYTEWDLTPNGTQPRMDSKPNGTQPRMDSTPNGTQPIMDLTPKWDDSTQNGLYIMLSCIGFFFIFSTITRGLVWYAFHYGFT